MRGVGRGEREMKVQYLSNTNKSGSSMVYDSHIPRLSHEEEWRTGMKS